MRFLMLLAVIWLAGCSNSNKNETNVTIPMDGSKVGTFVDSQGIKRYTGLVIPKNFRPDAKHVRSVSPLRALPLAFDWREQVALHPVRDQGNCGSCWAMATTSVFEDTIRIKGSVQRDLAEQFPLSCTKTFLKEDWSCNGGLFAYDIFKSPWGAVNEADFPYTASDATCKSGLKYYERIRNWAYIRNDDVIPSVEQIKSAIFQYGPVGVAVAVDNAFSNYRGGIHSSCNSSEGLNHAVVLVGWNDNGGSNGYWIMRNSWGTGWGEQGYMRIPYGCDQIGSWANYITVENENPQPTNPPNPEPTVSPNPEPTTTPEPGCEPQPYADTGKPEVIAVQKGRVVMLGVKPRVGTSYIWTAEPPFDNGAQPKTAQIKYQPRIEKILTVTAVTKCGSASDSVLVQLRGTSAGRISPDILH